MVTKQHIFCFGRSGIGVCGDNQTIFYAEVTDDMKVGKGRKNKLEFSVNYKLFMIYKDTLKYFSVYFTGGGNVEEGEFIEVVEMTVPEAKEYIKKGTVLSPGGCIFALLWFFQNKSTL
jgi:UDP-sugar diphosphatase